ncbi:hypothetical protein G6O67_005465 [Ophiocordyceps sinensis]|uniref:Uncharacterized protein n=1 Tax=Ophiocordyceps sinensis TaxID=72228 RepID=A0A8H4V5Y0_9HYPO|nr:hypothetical protein G6O67_005465 [Ophiocordyceps sinensis]
MHRVLAQQVDAKLLARLGEAQQAVEGEDVSEDPAALVEVREAQELERRLLRAWLKGAALGRLVIVVYALVLLVQGRVEDLAPEPGGGEHGADDGPELDVSVVELWRHGPLQLHLASLEAVGEGPGQSCSRMGVYSCTHSYFWLLGFSSRGELPDSSSFSSALTFVPTMRPIMGLKCLTQVVGPSVYICACGGSEGPSSSMLMVSRGVMCASEESRLARPLSRKALLLIMRFFAPNSLPGGGKPSQPSKMWGTRTVTLPRRSSPSRESSSYRRHLRVKPEGGTLATIHSSSHSGSRVRLRVLVRCVRSGSSRWRLGLEALSVAVR